MNTTLSDEYTRLVHYFLGELTAAEQEFVEERYMIDSHYSDLRDEVEMDLVDAYVAGTLTPLERQHFQRHYLTTNERKEMLRAAFLVRAYRDRAARGNASRSEAVRNTALAWRIGPAALVRVLAAGMVLLVVCVGVRMMVRRAQAPVQPLTAKTKGLVEVNPVPPSPPPAEIAGPAVAGARVAHDESPRSAANAPPVSAAPAIPQIESYGLPVDAKVQDDSAFPAEVRKFRRTKRAPISLGETFDQVRTVRGWPYKRASNGKLTYWCYRDIKITFKDGKAFAFRINGL